MNKRKSATAALALLMTCAIAATGCSKSGSEDAASKKASTPSPAPSASADAKSSGLPSNPMPIVTDGSVTLTVAMPDNPYAAASLTQNLPVWQEIEKVTGVKIKWEVVPNSQFTTAIQTRLASRTNLPDIIFSRFDMGKYGQDGLLIQLDDLLQKYGENAAKVFKDKPLLKELIKTPDGKIYRLAGARDEEVAAGPYGWLIRKDWLDKLGLKEPETVDDWYNVLKAFKEKDPNGNGKADEIPMTNYDGLAQTYYWGNAWGLHLRTSDGFYPDKNGKIQYEWLDPRAKEMVVFLNKLVKEGLLDMEFAVNNQDQATSKIFRGLSGGVLGWQESTTMWVNKLKEAGQADAKWVMTKPPAGPNGYKGHIETTWMANGNAAITKDSKHPDVALRWLDYVVYSMENSKRATIGIEGKTYTMKDGKPVFTDFVLHNPDGLGPVEAVRSIGAWQLNGVLEKKEYVSMLKLTNDTLAERAKMVEPYIVPVVEFAAPTDEEFSRLNRKLTDIMTYKDEMIAKFILGQEPLDKWDSFTKRIRDIGIDDVLAVRQAQYDRLQPAKAK